MGTRDPEAQITMNGGIGMTGQVQARAAARMSRARRRRICWIRPVHGARITADAGVTSSALLPRSCQLAAPNMISAIRRLVPPLVSRGNAVEREET